MALKYADRVKETTTTTGTGTVNLGGAASGYQTFVAGIGTTNTCYYCISLGSEWEVGLGTVTSGSPDTLARSVIASSNANALVSFSAGTKDVFCTLIASKTLDFTNASDGFTVGGGTTKRVLTHTGGDATITAAGSAVITLPSTTDTLVGRATTDTITGVKTFGSAGSVGKLAIAGTTSGSIILNATAVASGTLTLPAATDTLVGQATTDDLTNKRVTLAAGSTSVAPLKHSTDTLLSTPAAGAYEYDGKVHYSTHAASERGVNQSVQFITLTTAFTTAGGTTSLQKLFNSPTNGAVTVAANTTYFFECSFSLSSMSSSSGTFSFGFGGTATYTRIRYNAISDKGATTIAAALHSVGTGAAGVVLSAANTTTTGKAFVRGKLVIGTGGTIIPSFITSVAAASVVANDSYFMIWPAGSDTVQSVGNWS